MIKNLFSELNRRQIRYCHWKSNSHLNRSFNGKTDFDLLVDSKQIDEFILILNQFRFKRRYSSMDKVYPGLMDFIGLDLDSGNMYHLHVH